MRGELVQTRDDAARARAEAVERAQEAADARRQRVETESRLKRASSEATRLGRELHAAQVR